MKNAEFVALLAANTNKTINLRTYNGKWFTGAARVPNSFSTQIGHIIALLQAKIGDICDPKTEGLLVYDFQPLSFHDNILFCTLETLIQPLEELSVGSTKRGIPFHVVINGQTTEVCNTCKGLNDMGLLDEDTENMELQTFGNFSDFHAVCCFAAISSLQPIESVLLFDGKLNENSCIQECMAYDSFVEAQEALTRTVAPFQYIAELIHPKEMLSEMLEQGIGSKIIKLMNPQGQEISITFIKSALDLEFNPQQEVDNYGDAIVEKYTEEIQNDN